MEKNESIEQVLLNMDNHIIVKSKESFVKAILLMVTGTAFFVFYFMSKWPSGSFIPSLFFVLAITLVIWGLAAIFLRKEFFKSVANSQRIKTYQFYFDQKECNTLVRVMAGGDYAELKQIKRSTHDGLKLQIMRTKDGSLCYSQVIAYIPKNFETMNPAQPHTLKEAETLFEILK